MSFNGKPLIAWTIEAALRSEKITRIITTTDSIEISDVAKKYGSEVPFIRPKEYAQDNTTDFPVIEHALRWLSENESYYPELVVHLRPTTPLRPFALIDKGIDLICSNEADSLRCVCEPHNNPYKMWKILDNGFMVELFNSGIIEQYNQPRQLLPKSFWQIGTLDIVKYDTIMKKHSMSGDKVFPIFIDNKYAVDIDDEASLNYANYAVDKYGMFPK
jgi:N-acylneuraminate cytidylyltransferase